jgi:hypothetical protein
MNYIDIFCVGAINVLILLFFLVGALLITKKSNSNQENTDVLNVLIGLPVFLTLTSSIIAILLMGFKTIFIIAIFLILPWISYKPDKDRFKAIHKTLLFYIPFFIVFFLLKALNILTPGTNLIGTTAFDDFSYTSQINLLLKIRKETWFLELERGMFGQDVAIKPYHYFEFYLAIFLKFFSKLNTYQTYHLSVVPLFQAMAVGSGALVIRYFSKWKNYQVLLLTSCLFLCLRYTILDEVIFKNLPEFLVQILKHFAFQKVFLNDAGPHILSSYFGIKLCISMIFVAPLICLQNLKNNYKYLITSLLPIISITYVPFTILYSFVGFLINKFDFKWFLSILILGSLFIFYSINGNGEIHGDKVNFITKFIDSNKSDPYFLPRGISFFIIQTIEFTYLTILISFILIFFIIKKPSRKILLFFAILSAFPFFLYELPVGKALFYITLFVLIIFSLKKIIYNPLIKENLQITITTIGLFSAIICFSFVIDLSQIFILFFYCALPIYLGILISTTEIKNKNLFIFISGIIIIFNLFNLKYNLERECQPIIDKEETAIKIKSWFKVMPNHRAVHFNILTNSPFLASSMIGHEFLQYSDSVTSAWISIDLMTKKDSLNFKDAGLNSYVERFTFNSFYKKEIQFSKDSGFIFIQKKFIKQNDIHLVFVSDNIARSNTNYLKPIIKDSIRIEKGRYTAFLIDPNFLK